METTYRESRIAAVLNQPILRLLAAAKTVGFWDLFAGELPDTVIHPYIVWDGNYLCGMAHNIAECRMLITACADPQVFHRGSKFPSNRKHARLLAQQMRG